MPQIYGLHTLFQIVTMSSMLQQSMFVPAATKSFIKLMLSAGLALSVTSAIHLAIFVSLFWVLLGNGIIATQIVE